MGMLIRRHKVEQPAKNAAEQVAKVKAEIKTSEPEKKQRKARSEKKSEE